MEGRIPGWQQKLLPVFSLACYVCSGKSCCAIILHVWDNGLCDSYLGDV